MKHACCIVFFCFLYQLSYCQMENANWFFGDSAAIKFTTSGIVPVAGSVMNQIEGSASISDSLGNLLFYTDGITVWNKNNIPMPNGNGLYGHWSSTQSALIVHHPDNSNLYYIFTTDAAENYGGNGFRYSVVDITLNNGFGDVIEKNHLLFTPCTEKLTGIKSQDGQFSWVIAHEWDTTHFYSYKISLLGLDTVPIVSDIGIIPYNQTFGYGSQIKIAPTGSKLATINPSFYGWISSSLFIMDFSIITGNVSNPIFIDSIAPIGYGLEFSPDGSKLYVSKPSIPSFIYQYDLSASNISASKFALDSCSLPLSQLQLAYDGKIYCARAGHEKYLGVIEEPNKAGMLCNYVDSGVYLLYGSCNYGLPNFLQNYYVPTGVADINIEQQAKTFLHPNPVNDVAALLYNLGTKKQGNCGIYNCVGQKVANYNLSNQQNELQLSFKNLNAGIYFYQVSAGGRIIQEEKFIIAR